MNAPFSPPPVDLLTQAIGRVRPMLATGTTKQRLHVLWAAAKAARDLGASDVVADAFEGLAVEVSLIDHHGRWTGADVRAIRRYAADDIRHVISWAVRGMNPFEGGPLK
jgi:hypothetical protein